MGQTVNMYVCKLSNQSENSREPNPALNILYYILLPCNQSHNLKNIHWNMSCHHVHRQVAILRHKFLHHHYRDTPPKYLFYFVCCIILYLFTLHLQSKFAEHSLEYVLPSYPHTGCHIEAHILASSFGDWQFLPAIIIDSIISFCDIIATNCLEVEKKQEILCCWNLLFLD